MTNGFRGLLVGGGEPIYVKLKEVEKLAVRHFKKKHPVHSARGQENVRNRTQIKLYATSLA